MHLFGTGQPGRSCRSLRRRSTMPAGHSRSKERCLTTGSSPPTDLAGSITFLHHVSRCNPFHPHPQFLTFLSSPDADRLPGQKIKSCGSNSEGCPIVGCFSTCPTSPSIIYGPLHDGHCSAAPRLESSAHSRSEIHYVYGGWHSSPPPSPHF